MAKEKEVPVYNPFEDSRYMDYMQVAEGVQMMWNIDRLHKETEGISEEGDIAYFVNLFRKEEIEYRVWLNAIRMTLLNEEEAMEIILKKLLTNRQEKFISTAALFLMLCEKDPGEWIMANYAEMAGENAKAYMCLVLGVRGKGRFKAFLQEEAERFLHECPDEDYHIAAMIAVLGGEEQ